MSKVRFIAAMTAAKAAQNLLIAAKKNAAWHLPGRVAKKIMPGFPGDELQRPKTVIAVTGTDGKTTVCNMLCDLFTSMGYRVVCNNMGFNALDGIKSMLIYGSTVTGKPKADIGVFEIDERRTRQMCELLHPQYLMVTGLFRDSVNNNAHPEYIASIVSGGVPAGTQLILNADDLISSRIAPQVPREKKHFFGMDRLESDVTRCVNLVNDARVCPVCQAPLVYDTIKYHHIGRAHCEKCGLVSETPDVLGRQPNLQNNTLTVREGGTDTVYPLVNDSIFNMYNETAIITLLRAMGISREQIAEAFSKLKVTETRYSRTEVGSCEIVTQLAKGKNSVACSRAFEYVKDLPGEKQLIIMLDDVFDRAASSEDTAWIFDTDFEFLNDPHIHKIVIAGVRQREYRFRLLMAGIPEEKFACIDDEQQTPDYLSYGEKGMHYYVIHEIWHAKVAFGLRDKIRERILAAESGGEAEKEPAAVK